MTSPLTPKELSVMEQLGAEKHMLLTEFYRLADEASRAVKARNYAKREYDKVSSAWLRLVEKHHGFNQPKEKDGSRVTQDSDPNQVGGCR